MVVVSANKIWCVTKNIIKIVDVKELEVEVMFTVQVSEDERTPLVNEASKNESSFERPILALTHSGLAVWVVLEKSTKVVAFHANQTPKKRKSQCSLDQMEEEESWIKVEPLIEMKVTGAVNKVSFY